MGALTADECLTPLGCVLSMLPVEPAIGKLLVLGGVMGLLDPALTLAAALSVQSPFSRLADDNESARCGRGGGALCQLRPSPGCSPSASCIASSHLRACQCWLRC